MENYKLKADLWLSCNDCAQELQATESINIIGDYTKFNVGIEISSHSLIVDCQRHDKTIKIYRLHQDEMDYLPEINCDNKE